MDSDIEGNCKIAQFSIMFIYSINLVLIIPYYTLLHVYFTYIAYLLLVCLSEFLTEDQNR